MKHILFLCTGNTCRSPMAEVICRDMAEKEQADVSVFSRGLSTVDRLPASEHAKEALQEIRLSASNHRSRQLTLDDLKTADIIFVMTPAHRQAIAGQVPPKTKLHVMNVSDPYGGSLNDYRACRDQISAYLKHIHREEPLW